MEKDKYTVELIFDPSDTSASASVRSYLEGFGHLTPTRIEAAIAKGKIRLKRNAGYSEAKTILQRVRIEGAKCNLKKQPHAVSGHTRTVDKKRTNHVEAKVATDDVVCPKCKTIQTDTGECRQCGIIYSKVNTSFKPMEKPDAVESAKREGWKRTTGTARDGRPVKLPLSARKLIDRLTGWRPYVTKGKKQQFSALIDCGILFLTALLLEIALLFLGQYLWYILSSTVAGTHFVQTHPEEANLIQALLGAGVLSLSTSVVVWVLTINVILSFCARMIYLDRFYLDSDSLFVKTICILASALASAWVLCQKEFCPSLPLAFMMALPPTLCLLKSCLKLAKTILPEMGSIISGIVQIPSNLGNFITVIKRR